MIMKKKMVTIKKNLIVFPTQVATCYSIYHYPESLRREKFQRFFAQIVLKQH